MTIHITRPNKMNNNKSLLIGAVSGLVLLLVISALVYYFPILQFPKELVVAACTEDLSWIDRIAFSYQKVTVYNKCARLMKFKAPNVQVKEIANVGSCDNAFLTYIVDRYDTLPDTIEFTKGRPAPIPRIRCNTCGGKALDFLNFYLDNWSFTNNASQKD
jgi:hypothetical protein